VYLKYCIEECGASTELSPFHWQPRGKARPGGSLSFERISKLISGLAAPK